jgi:hypothetical protein
MSKTMRTSSRIALVIFFLWTRSACPQKPDQKQNSQNSATSELTIEERDRIALPIPANVKARVSGNKAVLSWDTSPIKRIVGYEVSRRKDDGPLVSLKTVSAPPFTDNELPGAGQFEYTVTAVDYRGNKSEASRPIKVRLHSDKAQK